MPASSPYPGGASPTMGLQDVSGFWVFQFTCGLGRARHVCSYSVYVELAGSGLNALAKGIVLSDRAGEGAPAYESGTAVRDSRSYIRPGAGLIALSMKRHSDAVSPQAQQAAAPAPAGAAAVAVPWKPRVSCTWSSCGPSCCWLGGAGMMTYRPPFSRGGQWLLRELVGTHDHGALEEEAHSGNFLVNAGDFEKLAPAGTRWRLAGSFAPEQAANRRGSCRQEVC